MPVADVSYADSERFRRDGFVIVRGCADANTVAAIRQVAQAHLAPLLGPAEFEADVSYPGAPADRTAEGGETPRRLLHAITRDVRLHAWATGPRLGDQLAALLGSRPLLSQCHHNCVMTKHPGFSSATGWHQDIRYWSFDRPQLVSAWLALGNEQRANGGLRVIPGSHAMPIERGRLDADLFLRTDLDANRALIDAAIDIELAAGDVLLFHCNLFHAADMNRTSAVKLSLVFTYHAADNRPIPGTRSANYPSLPVATSAGGGEVLNAALP